MSWRGIRTLLESPFRLKTGKIYLTPTYNSISQLVSAEAEAASAHRQMYVNDRQENLHQAKSILNFSLIGNV